MGIKDKKVTVVGLARSGVGAANLLSELGADVTVTDKKTEYELNDFVKKLNSSIKRVLGGHPEDIFISADMIVVSPGVQLDIPPIANAKAKGIPIIGELELAYQIIPTPFLAVTGTNGKSTTTALLDFMMRKGGFETILGGNIGNTLTEEIRKTLGVRGKGINDDSSHASRLTPYDYIVAEVSSFQLESIKDFRPKGATILNITPDHLDRYHSFEEYRDAKAKIFENQQGDDFLVINADDPETIKVESEKLKVKSKNQRIFYFSRKREVEGIYFKEGRIYCNFSDSSLPGLAQRSGAGVTRHSSLIAADEIKIKGVHNLENAMAASAMALLADCPLEAVIDSLREFPGLEHRLEFVREINGIRYINDSKGTNVGAVIKSLESFTEPIVLIAGGRDKAGDFSLLRHLVRERVRAIVLIGEASEKIKKALG
ncbi:MAG: UDP-N-acetylmuramoyl-L-alanine--D-glutamate ligase, partial [Nitrospirae bacterium]|nr:UDP-N-acetylmuramoyl-L-alanine--D-glutamate ligase [Nitrospirota bacterium]